MYTHIYVYTYTYIQGKKSVLWLERFKINVLYGI